MANRGRLGRIALAFVPLVFLAAYFLGGEGALILSATITTLLLMVPDLLPRSKVKPSVIEAWDDPFGLLQQGTAAGFDHACLVLQLDAADVLADVFGRPALEETATRCAARLGGILRNGDVLIRIDGGFAIGLAVTRRLEVESVLQLIARLQAAIAAPIDMEAGRLCPTVSVGFAIAARLPDLGNTTLLDAARVAAVEALRAGPSAIRAYAPEMAKALARREGLRAELEIALENGEIQPFFQPQISTDTGEVTGVEALARWQHPQRGLVSPAEFIPMLEEAGLMERLGQVMLERSLAALSGWDREGLAVPNVGVNFSALELRDPHLVEKLRWQLDLYDLTPERLSVEILETVIAHTDNDLIVRNISALNRFGCGLDLDDFGTGHASINSIRRFTVRRLKIDRSFIARVDQDDDQRRILSAILSMAETLGLETLAEGVETPAEHAMVAQLGCGHVQGFGIARPMPHSEAADWMRQHAARVAQAERFQFRTQL